jgi:hypothetical protein
MMTSELQPALLRSTCASTPPMSSPPFTGSGVFSVDCTLDAGPANMPYGQTFTANKHPWQPFSAATAAMQRRACSKPLQFDLTAPLTYI